MTDTLRIKRRPVGGAAGAPTSLAAAEIAYNEQSDVLYYGKGDSGGVATSIVAIGGPGAFQVVGGGGGIPEAPSDNSYYGRRNAAWSKVLPLTAGSNNPITGQLNIGSNTLAQTIYRHGAAGQYRETLYMTAGVSRWDYGVDASAEGGSDAGSNFFIQNYLDSGAPGPLMPLAIARKTGVVAFGAIPTHPTATAGDNSTQSATTAFVTTAVSAVSGGGSYLPLTGGTLSGSLTIPSPAGLVLSGAAGTDRQIFFYTGAALRWIVRTNSGAESGSNAGSDFIVNRYADNGAALGTPMSINRATGLVTVGNITATGDVTATGGIFAANNVNLGVSKQGPNYIFGWGVANNFGWFDPGALTYRWRINNADILSLNSSGTLTCSGNVYAGLLQGTTFNSFRNGTNGGPFISNATGWAAGWYCRSDGVMIFGNSDGANVTDTRLTVNSGGLLTTSGTVMVNGNRLDLLAGMGIIADANYSQILWDGGNAKTYYQKSDGTIVTNNNANTNIYSLDYNGNMWMKGQITVPGDSRLMNVYVAGGLGLNFTGVYNSGVWYAFGWDGTALQYAINGGGQGSLYTLAQNDARYKAIGAYTPNQVVDRGSNPMFYYTYLCSDANCYIGPGGSGRLFQYTSNWYWDWNSSTGTLAWMNAGVGVEWVMHANGTCYNNANWTGGNGAYVNISDERAKTDVEQSTVGLHEVLSINPIIFTRLRSEEASKVIAPRSEIGFSAQQLQIVIPEAVVEVGATLHDGSGGFDTDQPSLGVDIAPVVAALVNGMKELTARLEKLEAAA